MVTAVGNVSFHGLNKTEETKPVIHLHLYLFLAQLTLTGLKLGATVPAGFCLPPGDGFALKAVGMDMFSHHS